MALMDEARKLAGIVEQLRGPLGNSWNTRALLIEPILSALGWNTSDLGEVVRDWPLSDGVTIAYALRVADKSAILVEVRGVNESVDDPSFVTETLEHAAGDGAPWCVLTNGVVYRVHKTSEANESGPLFVVALEDLADGANSEAVTNLGLLHRSAVVRGELDRHGAEVFLDPRVRDALADLCRNPSAGFIAAVDDSLGRFAVPEEVLKASLGRVFDAEAPLRVTSPAETVRRDASAAPTAPEIASDPGQATAEPPVLEAAELEQAGRELLLVSDRETGLEPAEGGERNLADYLSGQGAEMARVFENLDEYASSLAADTRRVARRRAVDYYRGTRFWFTLEALDGRLHLDLALDPASVEASRAGDPTLPPVEAQSSWIGETEYTIDGASHLEASRHLIRLAYKRLATSEPS